jgi:hypothetical protein
MALDFMPIKFSGGSRRSSTASSTGARLALSGWGTMTKLKWLSIHAETARLLAASRVPGRPRRRSKGSLSTAVKVFRKAEEGTLPFK